MSGTETLSLFFDRRNRIDALELGGFDPSDSPVLISGFTSDPGAPLSNGTTSFANGVLSLTATSFVEVAAVAFANPQNVDLFTISAPEADAEGKGISLVSLSHTPQPQTLYREEFPNGRRSARPLAACGWDASSATGTGSGGSISPTQTVVAAGDLGSGDLGSATASSGGLSFSSASGNLFIGEEATYTSIGIVGSFKSTTLSQGENCDITPVDSMVVDEITFSGFGGNDSPILLSGFPSDPGATLSNGTAVFAGETLTLTATSFAQLATLSFATPPVLSTLNIRCNGTDSGAGGVGIHTLTYRAAIGGLPSTAQIAGIFGDDHAEIFASQSNGDTKAIISTEEDWIDHDPARYTGLELRWEQAGGANGANVEVRPMIEVRGQWFASATSFGTSADNSPFENKSLTLSTAAADWRSVTLSDNSAVLGPPPAGDLSGPITNLGFFADFSADEEDETLLLDRVELVGHPLFPDEEAWTFVSMPDFTNADIADMSGALTGVPAASGWDGGQNGSTAEIEDSFLGLFQSMTSESPDLFLVAGDLVEGEWFKDAAGRQIIGPVNSDANRELAFIEGSYYFYGHYQNAWFGANDLRVIACVGDHELGDNDWGINGANTKLIPTMRSEFSRWFTRFPAGQWSTYTPGGRPDRTSPDFADTPAPLIYPDRPVGSPHEQTAFALRHKDTLIISLDVWQHVGPGTFLYPYGGTVKAELEATQLAWVQNLLAEAEADPTIRHIITQCHTPILQPVLTTASSGMTYIDGESSPLFQAMADYGVDLHFSGEVHDIAASLAHEGVQQIVHGSPPGSRVLNYLLVRVFPDQLDCTIKTGRQYRDTSVPYWQPEDGNGKAGFAEIREPFKASGRITIDKSGPEKVVSDSTGFLANIEHDDYLLHYSFDHPAGTRQMPNEGTLPDLNADGQKKWLGDLDSAWLASPDFGPGKFGNALSFAGVAGNPDQINAGECPTPLAKPRTLAFWLRTSRPGFMNIAGYGDDERPFGEFNAQISADGRLQLDIGAYTAAALGGPVINDGLWHHCAIVVPAWDQSTLGEVLFYVDGVQYAADTTDPGETILTKTTSSRGQMFIGRHPLNTNAPFVGELDDLVLWGRGLGAAELSLLHAFGSSTLAYDVARADPLLKAFRRGEGVEIDGTTWFYVGEDLRGSPGTPYDLDSDYLTPLAPGSGMSTIGSAIDRSLKGRLTNVDRQAATVTLQWNSLPGATYDIEGSDDFIGWDPEPTGLNIPSEGTTTTHELTPTSLPARRFYRITETP
ncbi:LamG-like jellyroll fold domain-containing protein [Haloferula sp. A504]|uniref:LamG-like jellyroll fold domain-containing protein n=1 Tax=Haloferula sp. A504 TaxID=3373601 RepID=UPI0031C36CC4|nr:LamG domain-containing protein [Verrucomicrobiaceae bacterium E54]